MARRFLRVNVIGLALGVALHAFDAAYHAVRSAASVAADSLIHYNMLLDWWRRGDPMRGYTLTPSPYFLDLVLQVPLALIAPDFEVFSYLLALAFAVLILGAVFAVVRIAIDRDPAVAAAIAGVTVAGFYALAPFSLVLQSFIYNHTSEVFATLGLLALAHALFRAGAPRPRLRAAVYVAAVAACVASSPFFIATYCLPLTAGTLGVVRRPEIGWRRLAWFLGLTVAGALAGLVVLAIIARYAWPVRGDHYALTAWASYRKLKHTLYVDPRLWHLSWATVIAVIASSALAVTGWRTPRWTAPVQFLLTFFPACVVCCVVLPVKRGAFLGAYELRYLQLPWLLAMAFYVALAAIGARAQWRRRRAGRAVGIAAARPGWLRWSAAGLGLGGVALVVTARGPLTIDDPASHTSAAIRCFADADRTAGLEDGVATVWMARYLNAARLGPGWASPHLLVQIAPGGEVIVDARENNLVWLNHGYRSGAARLNFLVTHGLDDAALGVWRGRLGAPDRTLSCPSPIDVRPDGRPGFELWVWDRPEAQQRLRDIVTGDNARSPFAPVIGDTRMVIDVAWGMTADPRDGELVAGHRIWRHGVQRDGGSLANTRPMYLPSGRYRLEAELAAVPRGAGTEPVAEITVQVERRARVDRMPVAAGARHVTLEIEIANHGGPTSGDAVVISVLPRTAEAVELSGMTLTLLEQRGISPFEIFR
jgi:hypothetical protein